MNRIYNFSSGPAMLPESVLEKVKVDIFSYKNSGLGIMELSHRSKLFEGIINEAEKDLRDILEIQENYSVIFLTGGATTQFSMIPLNFLEKGNEANFLMSGVWSEKALEECKKFGDTHIAGSSQQNKYKNIPTEINLSKNIAYLHFTSNNTIVGTQFSIEPNVAKNINLVCDASSDLLYKKINVSKYALIYAGAQKNLGTAGVTIVILRKDFLKENKKNMPILLNYHTHVENNSLYNTAPTFSIYLSGLVFKWIKEQGGLKEIEKRNREKAEVLYKALDRNKFYIPFAEKNSRSLMNVTFNLAKPELEEVFAKEAEKVGLSGLKGHRYLGGIRASIYNAFPLEGVKALVNFMDDFSKRH